MNHDEPARPPEPKNLKLDQDSFNVPVKKSPLLMYALLQIPLVLFMVVLLYVMYQQRQN